MYHNTNTDYSVHLTALYTSMDPVTHALTGAAAAQSVARSDLQRSAAFTATVAALLPDLETFMHRADDPLFNIEIHRQFTHALVFIPVGALFTALLLWWVMRRHLAFRELFAFSFIGFATHGFLDAITSYGTELLWPFSDVRIAWNLVPIVDPLLTVVMAILVGLGLWYRRKWIGWLFFGWLALYLSAGFVQRERGTQTINRLAEERGHQIERLVVKPTIGNLLLWRSTYIYGDSIYVDAVRSGWPGDSVVYEGAAAESIHPKTHFGHWRGTTLYSDVERFYRFSDGFLIWDPERDNILTDARYSMLPNSLSALWGIQIDTTRAESHVPFLNFRDAGRDTRETFLNQLKGVEQNK